MRLTRRDEDQSRLALSRPSNLYLDWSFPPLAPFSGDHKDTIDEAIAGVQPNSSEPDSPTVKATTAAEPVDPAESSDSPSQSASSGELFFNWNLTQVGEGIKPAIDVEAVGGVHIAFLTEDEHGGGPYPVQTGR